MMLKEKINPKADWFFNKPQKWQDEYNMLREICLAGLLTEELKWGCPCYTFDGRNIVLIHGFKEYCALLFFKGALLQDADNILIQQTKNVQGPRQVRFKSIGEIIEMENILKSYIKEAIEVEKSGLKVEMKKTSEFKMPVELKNILEKNSALKKAFQSLTPGRQRGYILYFSAPKQSKTRVARIEKHMSQIYKGKGLQD